MIKDRAIIYDLNMKTIKLPEDALGFKIHALDLLLSSIDEVNTFETLPGVAGQSLLYNKRGTRDVSLDLLIRAFDDHDYNLKRNRLYTFFRQLSVFFIASSQEPNKLLKVKLNGRYIPQRFEERRDLAQVNISLEIVGQPYRISRYTSLNIHNNDIQFDGKWSPGMHLPPKGTTINGMLFDYKYVFNNETTLMVYNPSDIDLYVKQHLDVKIKFECLQSMNQIRLLDALSNEFVFTNALKAGDVVEIEGHRIKKNGQLSAEYANDVYPTLLSDYSEVYQEYKKNRIIVSDGLKVTFDFRYKYD